MASYAFTLKLGGRLHASWSDHAFNKPYSLTEESTKY
jgi:hypothetical protein